MHTKTLSAALLLMLACSAPVFAAELRLSATLDGALVVSATESPATGEAQAVLDDDGDLRVELVYSGLASDVTGAALHSGKTGDNGPQVATLDVPAASTEGRLQSADIRLTPGNAMLARAGEMYIVVQTSASPDGEIRGQLLPQPTRLTDPVE